MCVRFPVPLFIFVLFAGCGETTNETRQTTSQDLSSDTSPIPAADPNTAEDGESVGGAAEEHPKDPMARLLSEIRQLRLSTTVDVKNAMEANRAIVLKATDLLRLTMNDPAREADFLNGIRQLLEARFQLALNGTPEDVDQLYADVQALDDRDSHAEATAEGIHYLARFAHRNVRLPGARRTEWHVNFSRWAREFAERFPDQSERSINLLSGAARSCEMQSAVVADREESARLKTEARLCYVILADQWRDEPHGQEAVAVLRRLELPGKRLTQFSGPTLDGGRRTAEKFPGKVTVIFYWDSRSHEFRQRWLPLLQKAADQIPENRIRFVGVNLDEDPDICRRFVEQHNVPGSHIFYSGEKQRGWDSPLVRFWGISRSPAVWLVDDSGVVTAVDVRPEDLVNGMRPLFSAKRERTAGN